MNWDDFKKGSRYLVTWDDSGLSKQEPLTYFGNVGGIVRFRSDLDAPVSMMEHVVKDMIEVGGVREAFFAEVRNDPYAHMITRLVADAWAAGYEECLHELRLPREQSHREIVGKAHAWIANERERSTAQMIVALAQLGAERGEGMPR